MIQDFPYCNRILAATELENKQAFHLTAKDALNQKKENKES